MGTLGWIFMEGMTLALGGLGFVLWMWWKTRKAKKGAEDRMVDLYSQTIQTMETAGQ